jgi:4-hydroxy-3-methylbut-2-enyl diphosphate reductase
VLLPHPDRLDWNDLSGIATLGVSAGASAPELLVDQLIERLRLRFTLTIEERSVTTEDVVFKLPAPLAG